MKFKSFNFIALCLLVLGITVIIAACDKDETSTSEQENLVPVQIDFTTPLPATVVSEMVSEFQDIDVFQAQHIMHIGGAKVTGMVGINENDFNAYEKELPDNVTAFKNDMLASAENMSNVPTTHNGMPMQSISELHETVRNYELNEYDSKITAILAIVNECDTH